MGIEGRFFRREGALIAQTPQVFLLGPYEAEYGRLKLNLEIKLSLSYVAVCDPGNDRFRCKLRVERPSRWRGSQPETLVVEREFLNFNAVIEWLLVLELAILEGLFNDCRKDAADRSGIRVLLAIVDQIQSLKESLAEDEKIRRKMLE